MIISLCGNKEDKEIVINKLKEVYKDKIILCNYFYIYFNTCIETEKKKYEFQKKYNIDTANKMYKEYINKIVSIKMKKILNNRDKIIILITDNILSKDIDKTSYFNISDLKILIPPKYKLNLDYSIDNNLYNKEDFDIVLDTNNEIDIKKLVKI